MGIQELLDLIKECEEKKISITLYSGDTSHHVEDPEAFIQVWNEGTPEYEHGRVKWYSTGDGPLSPERLREQHKKAPLSSKDPRGPKSRSEGHVAENTEKGKDFLNVPAPKKQNTDTGIWILCQLSKLLVDVRPEHQDKIGSDRHLEFAKQLAIKHGLGEDMAEHCILEGLTLAQTDYVMEHLKLHFDRHNDKRDGYDTVICASSTTEDYKKRDAHIGYYKNACGAVPERREMVVPAIRHARFYVRYLPDWMKTVTHSIYNVQGAEHHSIILKSGTVIGFTAQPQHIDKIIFFSCFVWMLRRLHQKHNLSLEKFLELLLTVGWVCAPEVWWCVMTEYYELDELPQVCLSWDYLDRAEKHGGVNGGKWRRFQSGLNFEFHKAKVLASLVSLLKMVRAYEGVSASKVQYSNVMKNLVKHLHFVGNLCAQHVLHAGVMCGPLFQDIQLCQYSAIASGTKTSDKMKTCYGAKTLVHKNQILDAVASALDVCLRVGENIECKLLKVFQAIDEFLIEHDKGTLDESKVVNVILPRRQFNRELIFDEQTVFSFEGGTLMELNRDGTKQEFHGIGKLEPHDRNTTPELSDEDAWFVDGYDFEDEELSRQVFSAEKSKKGLSGKRYPKERPTLRAPQKKRRAKKAAKQSPSIFDYEASYIVAGLRSRRKPDSQPPSHDVVVGTAEAWVPISNELLFDWARAATGDQSLTKRSFTFWQHTKNQLWCAKVKFGQGYCIDGSDPNLTFFHLRLPGCKGTRVGTTPESNGERRMCYHSKDDALRALLLYLCIYGDDEVRYRWLHNLMDKKRFVVLGTEKEIQSTGKWFCYFYRYYGRIFMATPNNYHAHRSSPHGPSICSGLNPLSLIGQRVAKDFEGVTFHGTVDSYFPVGSIDEVAEDCWHVIYDDNDEEDVTSEELCEMVQNLNIA